MAPTSKASIATTEVLVSPKGEIIAVAPLTDEKGSLLSACVTPCTSNPPPLLSSLLEMVRPPLG